MGERLTAFCWFTFAILMLVFLQLDNSSNKEWFTAKEIFDDDLIRIGAHMRMGLGIPLTDPEKAAICDVAFRLPPPGGLPDAPRIAGQATPTSLISGPAGNSTEKYTGSGGGSTWLRQMHQVRGAVQSNKTVAGKGVGSATAAMLLDTVGTF